ncbi:hypothetical protein COOONC_21650 [Cooperia oncophora]
MVADVAYTNLNVTPIVTSKILPTHVKPIQSTRRTSSLTPTLTSSCSSQTCNRKRGYDISSLLNDTPSHDPSVTYRSSIPTSSAGQNPFRTKSCHNELMVDRKTGQYLKNDELLEDTRHI